MPSQVPTTRVGSDFRVGGDRFLIGLWTFFLVLTCARWFPAHVPALNDFPGVVPLASCLGLAAGCLAAGRRRSFLAWTPFLLALALAAAQAVDHLPELSARLGKSVRLQLPAEIFQGVFFPLIALIFLGPGQILGRNLVRGPGYFRALGLVALGGGTGIPLFMACTYANLGPFWWFLGIVFGLAFFLYARLRLGPLPVRFANLLLLGGILALIIPTSLPNKLKNLPFGGNFWSPYGRIDHYFNGESITVNGFSRQVMRREDSTDEAAFALALPHLLNRDAGRQPFRNVLVLAAGVGNEVERALQWGAEHVDAVEIDPVILSKVHWNTGRVTTYRDDGRDFLRACTRQYDLILYSLDDSPAGGPGNLRPESRLLTRQALTDVRRCLSPSGVLVLGRRFQEGWSVARLRKGLEEVFPEPPLVLTIPYQAAIGTGPGTGLVLFFAGHTAPMRQAFQEHAAYLLRRDQAPGPGTPNGFGQRPPPEDGPQWLHFGPAAVTVEEYLDAAEDDWPFPSLSRRRLPSRTVDGMALLAALAVLLLWLIAPARFPTGQTPASWLGERQAVEPGEGNAAAGNCLVRISPPHHFGGDPSNRVRPDMRPEQLRGGPFSLNLEMVFLGAGFMLLGMRTRAEAVRLFGGFWLVQPTLMLAVLGTLLSAGLFVSVSRPTRVWPYYAGLLAALVLNILFPLEPFPGQSGDHTRVSACLLMAAPILLGGIIGAVLFHRNEEPYQDCGAMLAGAVLGGLASGLALGWGFQILIPVAIGCFLVSAVPSIRRAFRNYALWDPAPGPHTGREGAKTYRLGKRGG